MTDLIVTDAAKKYLKSKLSDAKALRISIKKTGCSGYSYVPEIAEAAKAGDSVVTVEDVTIYLDAAWLHLLDGITIDYVEEEKSGLKQRRLVFTNKKESGRCGCGESFHVE